MFLEEKPHGEVTTDLKPSAAIRSGAKRITDDALCYLDPQRQCGCAIGMAAVGYGMTGGFEGDPFIFVANASGLSRQFWEEVEDMHVHGMKGWQIADFLEAQGY